MVFKHLVREAAILFLLLTIATTTPVPNNNDDHYDQRQKGNENYRLNWDGIVIAGGPAELFSDAISAADIDIEDLLEELNELNKPKPPPASSSLQPIAPPAVKAQETKPEETPLMPIDKPQDSKPDEASIIPDVKPEETKPENAPLSDISFILETKSQKENSGAPQKPVKGQRLKSLLANLMVPLLRRHKD